MEGFLKGKDRKEKEKEKEKGRGDRLLHQTVVLSKMCQKYPSNMYVCVFDVHTHPCLYVCCIRIPIYLFVCMYTEWPNIQNDDLFYAHE